MKLKHPVTGFVRDVTDDRRIQVLRDRGFVEAEEDAPLGVSPGPLQRDDSSTEGETVHGSPTVGETTSGASEVNKPRSQEDKPARSAPKAEWVAYAEAQGIDGADEMTKDELIEAAG